MLESEIIPNSDLLYRWVNKNLLQDGEIMPKAFSDKNLSTDWSRYCSDPEETRQRVTLFKRNPADFGVVSFEVAKVREIASQSVIHDPSNNNRSHCEIVGEKTPRAIVLLMRILNWEITI